MASRAAPALVAALAVVRAVPRVYADAGPSDPRASPPGRVDHLDMARTLAVMERYHRMSLEAIHANTDPSAAQQKPSADTEQPEEVSVGDAAGGSAVEMVLLAPPEQDVPPAMRPDATTMLPTETPTEVPGAEQASIGAEALDQPKSAPETASERSARQMPAVLAPAPKKKKVPRIPPSKVFEDLELAGDVCVPIVIVGGGTAAWSAIQAIRRRDPSSEILVLTEEKFYPYNRTPLSKELWAPDAAGLFTSEVGTRGAVEYTYAGTGEVQQALRVGIIRGQAVVSLDVDKKLVSLADGRSVQYKKLLLATGGTPRAPSDVCDAFDSNEQVRESVSVFRKIDDFRELRTQLGPEGSAVAVVGGGFLGTELAVAMSSEGRNVSLLCAEPGVLYKVLPRYLSQFLSRRLIAEGINVVESAVVTDAHCVSDEDGRVVLSLGGGVEDEKMDPVDKVVVATGILPRVELAKRAGLEIDQRNGGIVVNDQMNAEADVWVAGDAASYWDRALGRRRVEHWDHAVVSGKIAGDRMAGGDSRYGLQSMFWSDLDNVGVSFQAVGRVEGDLETVAAWNLESEAFEHAPSSNKYTEGVVWYLRNRIVVGAVLWNLHEKKQLAAARKAISTRQVILTDEDALALLPLPDAEHKVLVRTEPLDCML